MEAQEGLLTRPRLHKSGTETLGWHFTHHNRLSLKSPFETVGSLLAQKKKKRKDYSGICFQWDAFRSSSWKQKLHVRCSRGGTVTLQARHLVGGRIKRETQNMQNLKKHDTFYNSVIVWCFLSTLLAEIQRNKCTDIWNTFIPDTSLAESLPSWKQIKMQSSNSFLLS